jgi:hypothetical protein
MNTGDEPITVYETEAVNPTDWEMLTFEEPSGSIFSEENARLGWVNTIQIGETQWRIGMTIKPWVCPEGWH